MEIWATKILVVFLAWIIIITFALIPIKVSDFFIRQGRRGRRIMAIINCFGGGIFFGTYLLHMAPEVRMLLEESWLAEQKIVYPFPELFMGLGFFLVLYVEKICKTMNDKHMNDSVENTQEIEIKVIDKDSKDNTIQKIEQKQRKTKRTQYLCVFCMKSSVQDDQNVTKSAKKLATIEEEETEDHTTSDRKSQIIARESQIEPNNIVAIPSNLRRCKSMSEIEIKTQRCKEFDALNRNSKESIKSSESMEELSSRKPTDGIVDHPAFLADLKPFKQQADTFCSISVHSLTTLENTRSLILILSLSLHCLFEGMGLGLQITEARVWNLFVVLDAHEWVVAFSIGLQLTKCYSTKGVVIGAILYSFMTPSGIAIGTAISESPGPGEHNTLVNGILKAIAAGTFINVTFLEILKDKLSSDSSFSRILALSLGYVFMSLLSLVPLREIPPSLPMNSTEMI